MHGCSAKIPAVVHALLKWSSFCCKKRPRYIYEEITSGLIRMLKNLSYRRNLYFMNYSLHGTIEFLCKSHSLGF
jgi:hypothetical protein